MKTIVKLRDGRTLEFLREGDTYWYRCEVEGRGCLTVYRCWDAGDYIGRVPEASYAEGTWLEWSFCAENKQS